MLLSNVPYSILEQFEKLLEQGSEREEQLQRFFVEHPVLLDPFVTELHGALQRVEAGIKSPVGHIRIGAPMDFGSGLLTTIIGKFRKEFPEITFEILLAVPVKQLELLCQGKLDLAFVDNGDVHAGGFPVTTENLMKEEFILVASTSTFKRYSLSQATLENVAAAPIVDYLSHGPVARMWFKHHYSKEPPELRVVFSAESVRAVLNAVATDIGIGVVPDLLVSGDFKHLRKVETTKGRFINQIMIARQLGKRVTVRENEFVQFCKRELKNRFSQSLSNKAPKTEVSR